MMRPKRRTPQRRSSRQENFSEYHLYTLGRRTSIQNNESKQISLLTGTGVPVEKYLLVEGQQYYYRNPQGIGNAVPAAGESLLSLQERREERTGHAAAGRNRARLSGGFEGRLQFAGEDRIGHTPKDETAENLCRRRFRRGVRAQADGLQEDSPAISTKWNIRSLCEITRTGQ